jgi:hypothetical protein
MRVFLGAFFAAMATSSGWAQVGPVVNPPVGLPIPQLQNRIPAPLPPPPQPPVINGPLSQPPAPRVYQAPQMTSSSPKQLSCLREGRKLGLRGKKLNAYTRDCARPDAE